jgi:hypothetical protein
MLHQTRENILKIRSRVKDPHVTLAPARLLEALPVSGRWITRRLVKNSFCFISINLR